MILSTSSLRFLHTITFGVIFFPLVAKSEHGATATFEKTTQESRKRLSGKILNESLPVFWSEDGSGVAFHFEASTGKRIWRHLNLTSGKTTDLDSKPKNVAKGNDSPWKSKPDKPLTKPNRKSPNGSHEVTIRDNHVYLNDTEIHGPPPEDDRIWEDRVLWSPDSTRFVLFKKSTHPIRRIHFVESSPEDQIQPEHQTIEYPKPGDELNIPIPVIFHKNSSNAAVDVRKKLINHPFQLRNFQWRADSERFVFEFIERGFGSHQVIEINARTGVQRAIINESDEKFIYVYGNGFRKDLKGGDEILWLSERDGWNHLYLIDGISGEVIRQLTSGEWVVRKVIAVHEESRIAILQVSGFYEDQDPYHLHYAKLNLDHGKLTLLTEGDGTHDITFSPSSNYFVDRWSRIDHPPVHEIRRLSDGKRIAVLSKSSSLGDLFTTGWQRPERFVAKCRNEEYDIHGVIFRPHDFDPAKNYPVIESIYAGPHGSFTPKSWRSWHGGISEMANAGFIVVKLDGLGTNHRGKEFHQVAYKNLIDSGFPDRRRWITEAGKKVPQMDLSRIGIYGGSAGGQSTLAALLTHPDFYKAGVADCGCHDNRMDKIWWNEQWMDWPVGDHYEANSNLTHIDKLEGDLLLTVGELDKNVDPSSTYQVVNALIQADKDFEFIPVPGKGHGIGESPHLRRKRIEFFQRSLGGPTTQK